MNRAHYHHVFVFFCAFVWWGFSSPSTQTEYKKIKLGPQVNSTTREINPRISPDGRILYFTREKFVDDDLRREVHDKLTSGLTGKAKEEMIKSLLPSLTEAIYASHGHQNIWYSERQADGGWGPAKKMPPPLNGRFSSWLDTPLADGNTLLVGSAMFDNPSMEELNRRLFPAGQKDYVFTSNYLVALTVLSGEKWTVPAYLKFEDFKTASLRNDFELAPGNRVLLLSLITEESVGKRDLYVSFRKPDGTWSAPKDMGTPVNSPEDEIGPFIAADGVSLYFSSDRPGGYGGADIYLCKRLDDTWLRWSEPVNLGPDINTSEEEANLTVDGQGRYAFLSQGVMMQEDIYVFELPMKIRPTPVAFIRGRAHDPANNPVPATVSYERLRDGAGAGEANANRITGHYQIALPIGENYGFRADAAGYIAVSDKIDLSQAKPGEEFERDLLLVPVKIGATIRLNNVFFEFAKTKILPESKVELERLVAILNQYPKMEIEVAGHTDNVGDDRSNQVLSEGRAAAILQYLLDRGIALARLGAKGYGESMPVAPNDTDEHRQLNRRVEFIIRKME